MMFCARLGFEPAVVPPTGKKTTKMGECRVIQFFYEWGLSPMGFSTNDTMKSP